MILQSQKQQPYSTGISVVPIAATLTLKTTHHSPEIIHGKIMQSISSYLHYIVQKVNDTVSSTRFIPNINQKRDYELTCRVDKVQSQVIKQVSKPRR